MHWTTLAPFCPVCPQLSWQWQNPHSCQKLLPPPSAKTRPVCPFLPCPPPCSTRRSTYTCWATCQAAAHRCLQKCCICTRCGSCTRHSRCSRPTSCTRCSACSRCMEAFLGAPRPAHSGPEEVVVAVPWAAWAGLQELSGTHLPRRSPECGGVSAGNAHACLPGCPCVHPCIPFVCSVCLYVSQNDMRSQQETRGTWGGQKHTAVLALTYLKALQFWSQKSSILHRFCLAACTHT